MDMLVPLYRLPGSTVGEVEKACGVQIRQVYSFERSMLREFVEKHWTRGWADEAEMGFRQAPASVLIAVHERKIVGFAAYDCTFRGYFGPTGVDPAFRGKGIGKALLIASMENLKGLGYAYAVVGGVGPADFYAKVVNAQPIEGSDPGAYVNTLLMPQRD